MPQQDGDDDQGLRIRATVSSAYPELLDDLRRIPERLRGQRLVFWAAMGFAAVHSGRMLPAGGTPTGHAAGNDPERSRVRGELTSRLFESLPDE
ncbi:MAG: hypothetical protein RLO21_06965 [Nitratireductor sp.]